MLEAFDSSSLKHSTTILVVEDDAEIQRLLQDVLGGAGYHVLVTDSGKSALEFVEQQAIDLLLLDLLLPDMDGYTVCQRMRESSQSQLPIVMLTAVTQPQGIARGLRLGADDYIRKPFLPDELVLRIERILSRHREMLKLTTENGALHNMIELTKRDLESAKNETQTEVVLRRELLHNVTTHMQSLCAIIEAEVRKLPAGGERDAVQRIRGRVRGAALVYQISEALQTDPVAIGDVIRTTASALKSIYRPWRRITVTVEGPSVALPPVLAAPLAMVVNELITNCFKHAFPENRFGTITITYSSINQQFKLNIADDGVGFDVEQASTGNGRTATTQLVEGIGGSIGWQSSSTGTHVQVRVPLPSEAADA